MRVVLAPVLLRRAAAGLVSVLLVAPVMPAWAQGRCPEFQVDASPGSESDERTPAVASAPNGDSLAVWSRNFVDPGVFDPGIFGRRLDARGIPLGPEFRISDATTDYQRTPVVAADANGNMVVVWLSGVQVRGRRYDASGAPRGAEFQAGTATAGTLTNRYPAVAADSGGNFMVVWVRPEGIDPNDSGVFARRFDADGVAQGQEFLVNTYTTDRQEVPGVSAASNGDFVVVWQSLDQDGSGTGVMGQRFDATGARLGSEFQVNSYTYGKQAYPEVAHGANDEFIVTWWGLGASDDWGTFGRRFDAAGAPLGGEFQIDTPGPRTADHQAIAGDANGYIVVWQTVEPGDPRAHEVHGRLLDASGLPLGSEFALNTFTTSQQWFPAVARSAGGGYMAVWESLGQDEPFGRAIIGGVDCQSRFYTVTPCRIADTRAPPGSPLAANSTRLFPLTGSCGIPPDARALALNVTAVSPTDLGNLRLYPAGTPAPLASSLNFVTGRTRANNAIVALGAGNQIAVQCDMPAGSTGFTHLVLDVFGYFKR